MRGREIGKWRRSGCRGEGEEAEQMRMGCGRTAGAVPGRDVGRNAKNPYLHRCVMRAESIDAGGNGNAPQLPRTWLRVSVIGYGQPLLWRAEVSGGEANIRFAETDLDRCVKGFSWDDA